MMTRRDPWVNMLRTTLACFGAGVGGADAVTVLPFDAAIGLPDAFARRIARNTHSILLEESKVAGVIDPAGGSWYVEQLTDELAHAGWAAFQEIEGAGGIVEALDSGLVDERLAATRTARTDRFAAGEDSITGVTVFPNMDEKPLRGAGTRAAGRRAAAGPVRGSVRGRDWRRRRDDSRLLRGRARRAGRRVGRRLAGRRAGGHRQGRGRADVGDAGGHRRQTRLHRRGPADLDFLAHLPGHRAVPARAVPDDVRQPAVDHPPVRRVLHRRGVERLLPPQPRRRAEGPVGRVRPGHAPRLRLRPPARGRRRRHGRRGDRLDLRHAPAVRRHPAGQDVACR